jgi:O-antigen/teichoic acid export membrane protein
MTEPPPPAEPPAEPPEPAERYQRQLVRGAWVNAAGLVAKLFHPVFLWALTWMVGPELLGTYFLATFIVEIAQSLVGAGFADAATIYASHHADDETRPESATKLYDLLGNIFGVTLAGSAVVIVAAHLGADALATSVYAEYADLGPALVLLAWSIPFAVGSQVCIAATKARFFMGYDAVIVGLVTPVSLIIFSGAAWWLDGGVPGLMVALLLSRVLVFVLSVGAMARHFDLRRTVAATLRPRLDRQVLGFALPQNLNLTFNRYNTKLDGIMLAAFGFSPTLLSFYATGSLITTNVRQIKMVFASSLAPIVARHHHAGETRAFEAVLGRISRWTTTMVVATLLAVIVLRDDLLLLFDAAYAGDTRFVLVLLIPPFLSCAVGLAGNCITWCGHSRWTLANSALIAVINTGLNLLLIPYWGLLGAAIATAAASIGISALQLWELYALEGVRLRLADVYWPHVAFAGLLGAVWLMVGDPAHFGGIWTRAALAIGLVVAYVAILYVMGHPEVVRLRRRLRTRRPA